MITTAEARDLGDVVALVSGQFAEQHIAGAQLVVGGAPLAHARASGCFAVELEVDAEHARAARLYARAGFTQLARTRWAPTLGRNPHDDTDGGI